MPANYKISELPLLSTAPGVNVEFPVNDGGLTKKLTLDNLLTRVGPLASLTGGITNTSIVDAINYVYGLDAGAGSRGMVTTGSQTFAGSKEFNATAYFYDGIKFESTASAVFTKLDAGASVANFTISLFTALPGSTSFVTLTNTGQLGTTTSVVTSVATGAGLTGGPITSTGTITLAASGVVSGSYGNSTTIPTYIVDTYGRITSATNVNIPTASGATTGLLSSTDWTTFNNKLSTPGFSADQVPYWNGSALASLTNFKVDRFLSNTDTLVVPGLWNVGAEVSDKIFDTTTDYPMQGDERLVTITPPALGNVTITLPDSTTIDVGTTYYFKVMTDDGGTITIETAAGDKIENNQTSITIDTTLGYACIMYVSALQYAVLYSK